MEKASTPMLVEDQREIRALCDMLLQETSSALGMLNSCDMRICLLECLADEVENLQVDILEESEVFFRPTMPRMKGYTAKNVRRRNPRGTKSRFLPAMASAERQAGSGEQDSDKPGHLEAAAETQGGNYKPSVKKRIGIELEKAKAELERAEEKLDDMRHGLELAQSIRGLKFTIEAKVKSIQKQEGLVMMLREELEAMNV